jgi:hypothetical protein
MAISINRLLGMFARQESAPIKPAAAPARRLSDAPSAPAAKPMMQGAFRAVSIVRGSPCCATAAEYGDKRFLVSETPALPLAGCSMSGQCSCTYRKHADRRSGEDRRFSMPGEKSQWYHGGERRNPRGRRHDD